MNFRRRRKPFVGCCTMCCLVKTRGTRKRRLTRVEVAAAIGEREQTPCVCDGHYSIACDACGSSAEIVPERCESEGCAVCGGPAPDVERETLRAGVAERCAA